MNWLNKIKTRVKVKRDISRRLKAEGFTWWERRSLLKLEFIEGLIQEEIANESAKDWISNEKDPASVEIRNFVKSTFKRPKR